MPPFTQPVINDTINRSDTLISKTVFDLTSTFEKVGMNESLAYWINLALGLIIMLILAWIADFVTKKILIRILTRIAKKTTTQWDDIILERKVFSRLAHIVPAIILYYFIGIILADFFTLIALVRAGIYIYIILMILLSIDSFINSLHEIYNTLPISKDRSIKGYIQIVKIIIYFVAIILILSVILNKKPTALFTGLGAMAAVIMLVFKDTILGFVASIQLSANDMVRIGDWITMNSHGADGAVTEITLNTVKVQNWDKTISTIPTYALISESFSNWRGMEESGGRRIKRHILLDMKSVKFCTAEMIEKFKKIHVLKDYIEQKDQELKKYNENAGIDDTVVVNGRRMTNVGTFRIYLEEYLKRHPKIHKEMTFLVRQLQPSDKGIPIEIYVFSNDQAWANYESIQADIFDHILAVLPEFELSVYQNPTGEDFKRVLNRN